MNCVCGTLHIFCKHSLRICECTFCRKAATRPRQASTYGRYGQGCTTANQIAAIIKLAQTKQRSLPANISSWSVSFASSYIKYLISLPYPKKRYASRDEQFSAEHTTGTDYFTATRRTIKGAWLSSDGMTLPLNKAIELGDSLDRAQGITEEAKNV